jgi:DNA-directed RNA polymerase subunit RPC12/RpoP
VCLENFGSQKEKQAYKLVRCPHNICLRCIEDIKSQNSQIECPMCRVVSDYNLTIEAGCNQIVWQIIEAGELNLMAKSSKPKE